MAQAQRGWVQGKSALITGGANGLGRATCFALAREGARVVLTDLDHAAGEAVAREISASGAQARYEQADVTEPDDWARIAATTIAAFGSINILINNAGIAPFAPVEAIDEDLWDRVYDVNATSQFLGIKAVLPHMKNANGGSIVNIASGLATRTMPMISAYCASKGAARMLTRAAAADLSRYNIRVNSVSPGISKSKLTAPLLADDDFIANVVAPCPMGRPGEAEELANAIVFIASDHASFMQGADLVVDGGTAATTMRTAPNFDPSGAL